MSTRPTCNWTGESGANYEYQIWQLPVAFDPNQNGNYIFARQNDARLWVPIYIGEGDLATRVNDSHHQAQCIKSKGATHVHAHLNQSAVNRKFEETDLLARYANAYKPTGCNERLGG